MSKLKMLPVKMLGGGAGFFAVTFLIYFFNLDMKLIRVVYDKMGKHYDNLEKKDKRL